MKRFGLIAAILIVSIIFLSSCSKRVTNDNQLDTLFLMQNAIDNQDYEKFRELLLDSKKDVFTKKIS